MVDSSGSGGSICGRSSRAAEKVLIVLVIVSVIRHCQALMPQNDIVFSVNKEQIEKIPKIRYERNIKNLTTGKNQNKGCFPSYI